MTITPHVQWTTPAPLWTALAVEEEGLIQSHFDQPALLRFCSDNFMDEVLDLLANEPGKLQEYKAFPEVWKGTVEEGRPLKLYQPAHQRYYMVATNLVCRIPGLPDRRLSTSRREKTTFVIRRLKPITADHLPPTPDNPKFLDSFDEYAFVAGEVDSVWERAGNSSDPMAKALLENEEQYPLFGLGYKEETDIQRRLLTGLIPVGKYETFMGAQLIKERDTGNLDEADKDPQSVLDEINDPRMAYLHMQVIAPWRSLINLRENTEQRLYHSASSNFGENGVPGPGDTAYDKDIEDQQGQLKRQLEMSSWYILLDLAEFLGTYDTEGLVKDELKQRGGSFEILANSLEIIEGYRERLEGSTLAFNPNLGSVLAYPSGITAEMAYMENPVNKMINLVDGWPDVVSLTESGIDTLVSEEYGAPLVRLISDAIRFQQAVQDPPALPLAAKQSALASNLDLSEDVWFIIRCVFDRPNCVGQARRVVSETTVPFQMASFFDPEAPSRPIRISLPLDTSPAGLRKFSKNTAFVLSDVIACQIGQVQDISLGDLVLSVLPWPFHKALPEPEPGACSNPSGEGLVCSLSIPIVTICALLLLIIIAKVLDYFFRWIPYLIACFKLPGMKGKESS